MKKFFSLLFFLLSLLSLNVFSINLNNLSSDTLKDNLNINKSNINICSFSNQSVEKNKDSTKINYKRLAIVSSSIPLACASVFYYFQTAWWQDTLKAHHIKNKGFTFNDQHEFTYALSLDKYAHFFSCNVASNIFGNLMLWSGFNKKQSLFLGAGFAIVTSAIVEVKDGISPWWGFSLSDMSANILGSIYPCLQYKFPFLYNINFKYSYNFFKKSYYMSLSNNKDKSFLDDYESNNFWVIADIPNMFSKKQNIFLPKFLNFGMGLTGNRIDGHGGGKIDILFALDVNLLRINWGKNSKLKKTILNFIKYYHFPAPAIKVVPEFKAYPLEF